MVGALWDNVSAQAKELIRSLMAFDAGARLTVDQVLCLLISRDEELLVAPHRRIIIHMEGYSRMIAVGAFVDRFSCFFFARFVCNARTT